MAVSITHAFVSPVVDEHNPNEVGPDEWNASHTITGLDKDAVGLGNVDNTSDADKPVSTATQTALDLKANTADLATVATTGDYNDLINTPTIPTGDMEKATYDPNSVEADAFDQDNMVDGTTNKNFTATEKTKLAGIEALADVTDAANVAAAGAFMKSSDDSDDITEGASHLFLTTSERSAISGLASTYQPLDSDLTAIAGLSPSNDDIVQRKAGAWTNRTMAQLATDLNLAATYQPLDSDLTSWAGVTRASGFDTFAATPSSANLRSLLTDEVGTGNAYFTGGALGTPASGALTNCTGLPNASVVGLGTAALKNTGTSGDAVPLLNVNNTFGNGSQNFTDSASFAQPIVATSTNADANAGPSISLFRNSGSPADNDAIGRVNFTGRDESAGFPTYAVMQVTILDATAGTEDSSFAFQTQNAGTLASRCVFGQGVVVGSPTGGDKGAGTLNATAVYDDNVLLTCAALQEDFISTGKIDLEKWDAMVPDQIIPKSTQRNPVMVKTGKKTFNLKPDADGSLLAVEVDEFEQEKELIPVYDKNGNGIDAIEQPVFEEIETPERRIKRQHTTAHLFAGMIADGFDPRDPVKYIARLRKDGALPGLPNVSTWQHGSFSTGEYVGRLTLAADMLALVTVNLHDRVTALEGVEKSRSKVS